MSVNLRNSFAVCCVCAAFAAAPAQALQPVTLSLPAAAEDLRSTLEGASLTRAAQTEGRTGAQEVFAAAQADYGRILGALYAAGHYSGTISIKIDGREAADIQPLNAPRQINRVQITVDPGPQFKFSRAELSPKAYRTELPAGFAKGEPALSGMVRTAAQVGIDAWRDVGHAKAKIGDQSLTADHRQALLDARLTLAPGPKATFGKLSFSGQKRMKLYRLHKIAGLPEGETYSPEDMRKASERLRRSGVFRSVALTEAETLGPNNTLDVHAQVSEMPLRRLGFGIEATTTEGISLSTSWMHRNLLGGAERLLLEGALTHIGLDNAGGIDWRLGAELERPASFTPDTTARLTLGFEHRTDEDEVLDIFGFGFGLRHHFSDTLTAKADLKYGIVRAEAGGVERTYRSLSLPMGATWDRRDNAFDPKRGFWIDAEIMPFQGFGQTGSGIRAKWDARGYRSAGKRLVFAARLQGGLIEGADIMDVPRDYLFWSGGGGTVRGFGYQSLGVNSPGRGVQIGGTEFLGGSFEVRAKATESIGIVAFADYGRISDSQLTSAPLDNWHVGAGLGLRYGTPIGPIRLDIAAPVAGRDGDGVQFYLGIGQAF